MDEQDAVQSPDREFRTDSKQCPHTYKRVIMKNESESSILPTSNPVVEPSPKIPAVPDDSEVLLDGARQAAARGMEYLATVETERAAHNQD